MSTIVIADNHALMRYSIKRLLEQNGHTVVAETGNGQETLHMVNRLEPNLLILELDLPEMHGLDVISLLTLGKCSSKILALTAYDAENYLIRCLKAGASGFVSKTAELSEIQSAIKALLRGKNYFPYVTQRMAQAIKHTYSSRISKPLKLTRRETDILELLAKGYNNQEIAKLLMISHKTASAYKLRLLYKFNTSHLLGMIDAARRGGYIAGSLTVL
ncbi:response regulator transcription factor [Pseudomonas sp. MF7453]|uniref:response regulator transcription factor n=1 Tax=Pseudomonas sp. MF7453 TaxID=2797539 RepID=UPI0018E8314B|nr:response regulator transcription factor [Pseudomonas sp. MF7453]MBJ2220639.1 response regulator transcription factor [Pseudomonas sp. MF7453]